MRGSAARKLASIDYSAIGAQVLRVEAQGLLKAAEHLGAEFQQACELLASASGRIVVSGMGKSGHIGRKIAATLSSIGCPSFFVHPGEASHGDLGMIVQGDVLLAISNSGATAELADMLSYCHQINVPIVSLTSNPRSRLGAASTVALSYPPVVEACSIGMAPTTSTTVTLAMGDALAVALMTALGTTAEHFGRVHPGGKLGAQLITVSQLMRTGDALPIVRPDQPMPDVIDEISQKGFGTAIVCDSARTCLGVVTDGDMRRHLRTLWSSRAIDVANTDPVTAFEGAVASTVLQQMIQHKISAVPVVSESGKVVGLLHIHDCLKVGI